MKTAREEVAHHTVEVIEVAKASLDHGEQMLAIACQGDGRGEGRNDDVRSEDVRSVGGVRVHVRSVRVGFSGTP